MKDHLMTSPYIAQASDAQQLEWIGGGVLTVLLDAQASGGQLAVMSSELEHGHGSPVHVHTAEDELMVILSGNATFWLGQGEDAERHEVAEGGLAWLPRGLAHTYRIDSDVARFLTICTPGGFEGFFRQAGHDLSTPKPEGWALTPQSMGAALAAHGGTVLGPPRGLDE
jgi:quercetin dioxygenase-like cupin family protein